MKLIPWIIGLGFTITIALFSACFWLAISQTISNPTVLPRPIDLTCMGADGYYKPANGRNYIMLNDEWCK